MPFENHLGVEVDNAKLFLEELEKNFAKNEKIEINTFLGSLFSTKYKSNGNISEYIMEMFHLASKLKVLKLELSNDLLGHLVLIFLPTQFNQFKVSYKCQKEKWSFNELISHCVQEEEGLKQERIESTHLTLNSKDNKKKRKKDDKVMVVPP